MRDEAKTREELIGDLEKLRRELAEAKAGGIKPLAFSSRDAAESSDTEQKLQCELSFQQTLIDTVPIPIYYKDIEGRFLGCNKAFERFFGVERGEIVGKTVYDIAPEELAAVYHRYDRELLENPGVQIYETRARDSRGQFRDVVSHKATFAYPDGRIGGVVGAMLDVSGRKRAEEAAAAHVAQVESLNEDLQEFAFVASHDLLEPLRKIQGFGDLLRNRYRDVFDEEGRDFLDRMTRSANRMEMLLAALLDYSRLGMRPRNFKRVALGEVVRDVVSDLEWSLQESGGLVEIGELPMVEADAVQLRQVFQNLVSNSLKYRRENETPVVRVWGVSRENQVEVSVEDNGIGFNEQYLDRIFKPFQRLHGRSAYDGIGMGLAICRKIIERHGGSITARSEPGAGSTFIVCLPVRQSGSGESPRPEEKDGVRRRAAGG